MSDGVPPRDPAELLAPLLAIDTSRRSASGIRVSLPAAAARATAPAAVAGGVAPAEASGELTDVLQALEYAVVDVETTGASARRGHRVTEVAAVRMRADGSVIDEFTTLVNPERPIPPFITALTSISWEMVANAPRFADIANALQRVIGGAVFVAHNAAFDRGFISAELARLEGPPLGGRLLCTVRMARRLVPEIRSRSLDALSEYFGVTNAARHRAYGDARATAIVLRRLLERAEAREVRRWAELDTLLTTRSPRRKRRASPTPVPDP